VDGGVLNNIPVKHVKRIPGDILVVVNVNADIPIDKPEISREEHKERQTVYQKKIHEFNAHLHKILPLPVSHEEKLGYFNLMSKTISLMTQHIAQMTLEQYSPDMLIEISRDSCGTYDFYRAAEMVEMGKHAAVRCLEKQ
jgi:NTE family protein